MIGIQTWFELSINYFEDFWVEWKKGGFLFFQRFKYESISTPKITDKVGASGVLYLARQRVQFHLI
jgi:hypothetical protein